MPTLYRALLALTLAAGPLFAVSCGDDDNGMVGDDDDDVAGDDDDDDGACEQDDDCDDANICTINTCNIASGICESANADDGTECDGAVGLCAAGVCEPRSDCEYVQSFELLNQSSPTALSGDGWLVFGAVFDGVSGDFEFQYGPEPAPNADPLTGFSAIASDQGGPSQGAQQLIIISDYNNRDAQDAGDRVVASTYRDRTIVEADVGQVFTFTFDAKKGNINDPDDPVCDTTPNPPCDSGAFAYIRTVDPKSDFSISNDIPLDTTDISVKWLRYSLEFTVTEDLVGQLLQFGFTAEASNDEPSGIFYDNIAFCSTDS